MIYLRERRGSKPGATIFAGLLQGFAVLGCAARYLLSGIVQRREIQVWRNRLRRGRDQGMARIVCSFEKTLFDFAIAFADVVLHFLRKGLQLFHVRLHGVREIAEVE